MQSPQAALAAAARPAPAPPRTRRRVLLLGGAGMLGAQVLEQLLGSHRFERVAVLADPGLRPALRGLQPLADEAAAIAAFAADTALLVYDRQRHANGREAAFMRPEPAQLVADARRLHTAGVRRLLVVVPHTPALLPAALKAGLATLDEGAVSAMGFEQLVFMRMAQSGAVAPGGVALSPPQRLAAWMLSQLGWLVPQREQPVRSETVARLATALAVALPAARPATRVLPPEVLWQAAQGGDVDTLAADWLAGRPLQAVTVRTRRY